jgi:hypothetical protein
VAKGAIATLEERTDAEVTLPQQFQEFEPRIYGDTKIVLARMEGG